MQPEEVNRVHECRQLLQLIVDGQATPEQETHFRQHLNSCVKCLENYQVDNAIKEAIQKKVECKCAPSDLIKEIQGALNNLR